MDAQQMQQALQEMLSNEVNKTCADCQDSRLRITHVSVNNAAFLCSQCAEEHMRDLTPLVSLVRPVDSDFWSEEQIGIMRAGGGNIFFNTFLGRYDLSEANCERIRKYNSVGCQYWRDKLHQMQNGLMPQTEIPTKQQGMVQLDRDVEGDWLLVDKSQAYDAGPAQIIDFREEVIKDNDLLESEGKAYLDENEDEAYANGGQDHMQKFGSFIRRQSTQIKTKIDRTDFKGGAQNLGKSIASTGKRTGAKISEGVKEIKLKETSQKVGRGFMRFATKVKGLFSNKDEESKDSETVVAKFKTSSSAHDKAKAELKGDGSDDGENSPVPDMLKLEGHSDEESDEEFKQDTRGLSDEEDDTDAKLKGSSKVIFFGRQANNQVVRDYREQEKADALDEEEERKKELEALQTGSSAQPTEQTISTELTTEPVTQSEEEEKNTNAPETVASTWGTGLLDIQNHHDQHESDIKSQWRLPSSEAESSKQEAPADVSEAQKEALRTETEGTTTEVQQEQAPTSEEPEELEEVADMDEFMDEIEKEQNQLEVQKARESAMLYLSQHEESDAGQAEQDNS